MNTALLVACALAGVVAVGMLIEDRQEAAVEAFDNGNGDTPTTVTTPAYKPRHSGKPSRWLKDLTKQYKGSNRYKGRHKRPWRFFRQGNGVK